MFKLHKRIDQSRPLTGYSAIARGGVLRNEKDLGFESRCHRISFIFYQLIFFSNIVFRLILIHLIYNNSFFFQKEVVKGREFWVNDIAATIGTTA